MNFLTVLFLALSLLLVTCETYAQFVFERNFSIPVSNDTASLPHAWFGGLNNPMFSSPDLNNDGIADLVIFDKSGDALLTFLNRGTPDSIDYEFSPQYKQGFPKVNHWMLMDDYNCDGITDLFKSNPAKIDLWLGSYNSENELQFDSAFTLQYNSFINELIDVFVTPTDIPAIADINGDGDLDVLKLNETFTEPRTVYYYENQSYELTGRCEALSNFELIDECWGNFVETGLSLWVEIDSCGSFKREEEQGRANGVNYSFLAFDEDGDGDKELLMGLSISDNISRMVNDGTADSAHVSVQDILYPDYDVSFTTPLFAVPSLLDVNNDGLKDLLIAPRDAGRSENYSCAWYYKNVGTSDSAIFQFQTEAFLNNQALDFGEGAYPTFFDHNLDGLSDLVVGNYGYYINGTIYRSGLALLENTGTAANPSFKLLDDDYARINSLALRAVTPSFGDMDNDGDADMIIGEFDGFLHYFENTAAPGNPASFPATPTIIQLSGIDVGQFSTPFIFDVNGDMLLDLVVGEKTGNINYFENKGTATSMSFDQTPTNSFFGRIDVRVNLSPSGYATVAIGKLDPSGKTYLITGAESGYLSLYEFNQDSIYRGSFKEITAMHSNIREGEKSAPAITDLDNDGKMEMVVGNYRGGVSLFSQTDSIFSSIRLPQKSVFNFDVFPNPASDFLHFKFFGVNAPENTLIELYDMVGKKIMSWTFKTTREQILVLPEASAGIYFVKVSQGNEFKLVKVILQ